jgi:hypothetical protein
LLAGGMAADTPVAMIENASLPHQRECRSDLMAMEEDAGVPAQEPGHSGHRHRGGLCNVFSVGAACPRWWPIKTPDLPDCHLLHQIAGKEKPGLSRAFLELQLIT